MKPLSTTDKLIRFICAPLAGVSMSQAIIYFSQESNWGMICLIAFIFFIYITLLINTWHS